MKEEFYKNETQKNNARKIVWAIFILAILAITTFFLYKNFNLINNKIRNAEKISQVYYKKTIYDLEKRGVKLINILPPGEVLGLNKENKNLYKNEILMFRGTPKRDWYGNGEIPTNMEIKWRYPNEAMCAESSEKGETKKWCGTGWTGQPVVYKNKDQAEIIFGAYDKKVHFVDPETGKETRSPFETEDIIKGSVTVDPDGFPFIYFGSRDNKLRIVSLEKEKEAEEIWALDSKDLPGIWNDDWDGNPVILNDVLYTGGENGWFFAIKLNRKNTNGKFSVNPEIIFSTPSYDKEFLNKLGDSNVSIENSVNILNGVAYFGNSGGRVLGVDIKNNPGKIIFDFWAGDDIDSTIITDDEGNLYVGIEEERLNERSKEVGQFIKIDPKEKNPLKWNIYIPSDKENVSGGVWATPAMYKNYIYLPTNPGDLLMIDKNSGKIITKDYIGIHAWSSPIISNDKLLVATCEGKIIVYDLKKQNSLERISEFQIPTGSCIESTPALFDGEIYFGARDGFFYKIGNK